MIFLQTQRILHGTEFLHPTGDRLAFRLVAKNRCVDRRACHRVGLENFGRAIRFTECAGGIEVMNH